MTVHWSFETLSGDAKSPCLPGDPSVRVNVGTIFTGTSMMTAPCASGSFVVRTKASGSWSVQVESMADHAYRSRLLYVVTSDLPAPGDFPTAVIYTDAGDITIHWNNPDNDTCDGAGISSVRVIVDGVAVEEDPCSSSVGASSTTIGPILEGVHSVSVEGLRSSDVVATSDPIDVTVVSGQAVTVTANLRFN
jgi:hypothetical protein